MQMEYRRIADLDVSVLCLGAWMFGGQTLRGEALRIIEAARDASVNFIDTADVYADGESERIVGAAVAGDRDRWVVATKAGAASGGRGGLARPSLLAAMEGSRRRLRIDCVDIYYLHQPDPETELDETLETLGELMAKGKARHFGVSNYAGWEMADMVHRCRRLGVPQPVVCQPYYNILNRVAEVEVLPAARHFGIGAAIYSPLAGGMLTGKYRGTPGDDARGTRGDTQFSKVEFHEGSVDAARRIADYAERRGMKPAQFATRWAMDNADVTSAIAGPRTAAQWTDYLGAVEQRLDEEDEAFVSSVAPPGQPSTPGFTGPWGEVPKRERHPAVE